jgi:hypothetical protein
MRKVGQILVLAAFSLGCKQNASSLGSRTDVDLSQPSATVLSKNGSTWGMDGFSLAYGVSEDIPTECSDLEQKLFALYRQKSSCVQAADCIPFGTCDAVNRSEHTEGLVQLQKEIIRKGCKVSWGNCRVTIFVCKNGRCVR